MKKIIIGSLAGSVILFVWGAISWMLLPIHLQSFHYTPAQDSILSALSGLESGAYMVPAADNRNAKAFDSKYQEECMKMHEVYKGKPMATIMYIKEGVQENAMTFVRGLLFNFISVMCVCIILAASSEKLRTFFERWWMVLLVSCVLVLQGPLMGYNWMGLPWHYVKGMVIDAFVSWGLCGAWLAWYFGKK